MRRVVILGRGAAGKSTLAQALSRKLGLPVTGPGRRSIVVLDFPLWRCAWRAVRRSRETREFWSWGVRYRRDSLPAIRLAIATHAPDATGHTLRNPRQVWRFLEG